MMYFCRRSLGVASVAFLFLASAGAAHAASVTLVALGTSNTRGRGVPPSQSYPTQLQAALKLRGHHVQVINMGVNGASSAEVLARVGSVPSGTALVLYEYARDNDRIKGVTNGEANMAAIQGQLAARGIRSIEVTNAFLSQYRSAFPRGMIVMDYGPHLNGQAYSELVQSLLPQVEAALGR
jgi:acyl-CoA thioesterase I